MAVLLLSLFFAAIIAIQVPPMLRRKNIREMLAYSIMMLLGMAYSYGYVLDFELPNPTRAIDAVFKPVTEFLDMLLG